jgi:hypothetical protein
MKTWEQLIKTAALPFKMLQKIYHDFLFVARVASLRGSHVFLIRRYF